MINKYFNEWAKHDRESWYLSSQGDWKGAILCGKVMNLFLDMGRLGDSQYSKLTVVRYS